MRLATVRSVVYTAIMLLWTLFLAVLCPPTLLFPKRWAYNYSCLWANVVLFLLRWICGLGYWVRGRQYITRKPVIYALKHQSAWETIAMLEIVPAFAAVLKKELAMVRAANKLVGEGRSIMIMPEGTRLAPGETGRYHPGIAALYKQLNIPVVPVALNSGLFWGKESFTKLPGTVTIEFLEPIPPGLDRETFMATLADRIEPASQALYEEGLREFFPGRAPATPASGTTTNSR
jgi:1-acyl-sn-glycerol-3-phosphate acyltransferase